MKTITISLQEYEDLLLDSKELICLERAGVDNWEGYDLAMEEFYKEEAEDY